MAQYLRDPDLWPTVLSLNDFASPVDLVPGITLKMPPKQVEAADAALSQSLEAIEAAIAEGAQIFAPGEIGLAIENRDAAVAKRGEGEWR